MNDWTIPAMERGEMEALQQMVPFVDRFAVTQAPVLERRQNVRLRAALVKAAVESCMDGGRPVIVEHGGGSSFRVMVEPGNTILAVASAPLPTPIRAEVGRMNDWTIPAMEHGEAEALNQLLPFVWRAEAGAAVARRKSVNLRSRLAIAAVESFMDGGRPVVVECGASASFRITVEPIAIIQDDEDGTSAESAAG